MKEYLDIVDKNGDPTGEIVERSIAHSQGIWHRTSHLWLVRKREGRIQILLQKRAEHKESFPGCYDISSAGHIPAGVDYKPSAIRELKEELGIDADESELIYCGNRTINWDDIFFGKVFRDRQITKVFLLWRDLEEDEFTVQVEEVESVRWMDFDECVKGVKDGTFKNCISTEELGILSKVLDTYR